MKMRKLITTLALAAGITTAFGDILTEQPYYWYKFDSNIRNLAGTGALTFSSNSNGSIADESPWGHALKITKSDGSGPYGSNFALGSGDWTYHVRAKLPTNLANGVIWNVGSCKYANGLLLLTRANDAGVSIVRTSGKMTLDTDTRVDIDYQGLSSDYHDFTAVYTSSSTSIQLYIDGAKAGGVFTSPTAFTGSQAWQWFAPYVGANGVKAGYGVLLEEMRFWQKALSDDDIAALHTGACNGTVTLEEDTDWSEGVPEDKVRMIVDMNGHALKLPNVSVSEVYRVENSAEGDPAKLTVVIPDGESLTTYLGQISGNIKLCKEGAGTTAVWGSGTGDVTAMNCDIDEGTLKLKYLAFGDSQTVTVGENGTLDENGVKDTKFKLVMKDGAMLTNTGSGLGYSYIQFAGGLTLEEGATVYQDTAKEMSFTGSSYAKVPINLNGGTLVETGTARRLFENVEITGTGTVQVLQGELNIAYANKGFSCDDETVFELNYSSDPAAYIWVGGDITIPTITGDGNIAAQGYSLTVSKRFSGLINLGKPNGDQPFTSAKPLILGNMAVLDLNGNTDIYTPHNNMQFSSGTNVIDISERTLNIGTQVVAWNSSGKPATTFVWDETTAESGVKLVANDVGIFYGQVVVDAEWKTEGERADDNITNPDNWTCTDSYGEAIAGGIPSTMSNITIPDGEAITYPMGTREGSFTLGSGATLTIDLGEESQFIEGTTLMISSAGTFSIDSDATVTTSDGVAVELASDSKALLYAPAKTVVARWDFNGYNSEAPLSTNVLAATTGEAGFPCHYPGAGSTNITDGTIGGMSVTNVGLTAGNYAIVIPQYYHVKLPLPKTVQHSDWTIRMRFYNPTESQGTYRAFFTRNNTADADLFINKENKVGGGKTFSGGYTGDAIAADQWHLLTVSQRNGFGAYTVDGVQTFTWTDNRVWNFYTDKDYLYLSADNSGEDGLLYIDYIELAVEPAATWTGDADDNDITNADNWQDGVVPFEDGAFTGDVTLAADADWTDAGELAMNNKTIDVNGRTLTIAATTGTGKVYDSTADVTHPGLLVVNVAEGETYKNDGLVLSGNLRLVKEGAGTYSGNVNYQTYTGGTIISNGTIKAVRYEKYYCLGKQGSDIRIAPNGVLELNSQYDWGGHQIYLDGGTISNVGASMTNYGWCGLANITLTADSTIIAKYHIVFNKDSSTVVELGGHTLNFVQIEDPNDDKALMYFYQTKIQNGTIVIGQKIVVYPIQTYNFGENVTIVNNGDFRFEGADVTTLNFTDASMGHAQTRGKTMSVTGRYTPKSTNLVNAKLMSGATMDLTEQEGAWTFQNTLGTQTLSYEEDATITVDVSGRTFVKGDQVVGWSAKPEGITFQWDATTAALGAEIAVDEFGIFYDGGYRYTVDINNGGTFTIPNEVADADLDSVRLFYADGKAVSNPVRNGRTITFDWEITGGACWWDYEFDGNGDNTGTEGTALSWDKNRSFKGNEFTEDGELRIPAAPWRDVSSWPETATFVLYGTMVGTDKTYQLAFGSAYKGTEPYYTLFLATDSVKDNTVNLCLTTAKNEPTVLCTMTVPNAQTAKHLYAFTLKTVDAKTVIDIYLDGELLQEYPFATQVVLGAGFQIGSGHGGCCSGYSQSSSTDTAVQDFLRVYNVELSQSALEKYAVEYPYVSPNGSYQRTVTDGDVWSATEAWTKEGTEPAEKSDVPVTNATVKLTVDGATTLGVNLADDITYEAIMINGGDLTLALADGETEGKVISAGRVTVNANVTFKYDAFSMAGAPLTVKAGKTVTFDLSMVDMTKFFTTQTYDLTGYATLETGATITFTPPAQLYGRTISAAIDPTTKHYVLTVSVPDQPFVYTIAEQGEGAWTWNEQAVDEATVLAQSAATIKKAGAGTQQFLGLTKFSYIVDAGTLQFTNTVTDVTSTITVNKGATFDMNGRADSLYNIVLSGGTLANYGAEIKNSQMQLTGITLTADSYIDATKYFCMVSYKYAANTIDLGENTLEKKGKEYFLLYNTTVTNGTFKVTEGQLRISAPYESYKNNITFVDATLELLGGSLYLAPNKTLLAETITGSGSIENNGTLNVSKRIAGFEITGSGTMTLAEGAVLDLAESTTAFAWPANVTCGPTQTVNLVGRDLAQGEKLIAWTAIPEGVTFVWDEETAKAGVEVRVESDGLYYGINYAAVDKAHWTGAAGDGDAMNPANWACTNLAGYVVADGIPTNEEATVILNAPLAQDCDWTGLGAFAFADDSIIDLNGYNLAVGGFANRTTGVVITNSVEATGDFIVNVAEEDATAENTTILLAGNVRLVKEGKGGFVGKVTNQTYTGGTVVNAGFAAPKYRSSGTSDENYNYFYGPQGNPITVNAGGMFKTQGQVQFSLHPITLNGGTIGNDDLDAPYNHPSVGNVTLTDDSVIDNSKQFIVWNKQNSTVEQTDLELQGYTLTKKGAGKAAIYYANITGGGKIVVEEGEFNIGDSGFTCDANLVFDLRYAAGTYLWVSGTTTVPTIIGDGNIAASSGSLTVTDLFSGLINLGKPNGDYPFSSGTLTLADGATLDLSANTGIYTPHAKFRFAEGATITVDLTGRTLANGEQVIAWTTEPDATFVARGANVQLVRKSDGLYAERNFMIFVAYGTAGDFSYVAPDAFTNAQWAEGQTNRVVEVVDAVESNATLCVDFAFSVCNLYSWVDATPDATGALIPAALGDGNGFYGWGDGAWHALPCADVATDKTLNCRIEQKKVGEAWYVRYQVKGEGEQWNVLYSRTGREWFETTQVATATQAGMTADETLASIVATCAPAVEPSATFYWIGSTEGAWSDTNNWSLVQGGVVATRAPGLQGDLAQVAGDVTIDGVPTRDLVVAYGADGEGTAIGGKILGEVTLDTSRPCAGVELAANVPTLFGRTSDYDLKWYCGSYAKDYAFLAQGSAITPTTDDYEHWYKLVATDDGDTPAQSIEFYFSKLPVCYLTTDDGQDPSTKKEEHDGQIRVQGNDEFKMQYEGAMAVKLRGNSTLNYPKKAYKVKLDKKTDMFGMGKQKHWVLLANYNDMANQRNKLAYDLANDIGSLGMNSTWVICMFNGEYKGLYQFGEHIRVDKNRVNIRDWESIAEDEGGVAEDLSIIDSAKYDITGSYLMEFSSEGDEVTTWTATSGYLQMVSMANKPEYLNTNSNMYDFVKNFMQEYWDACTNEGRKNPTTGKSFKDYSDLDSMALYTIVNELFTNHDACKKSRYAYIDDPVNEGGTGKLVWGPVWDFDWGAGSAVVGTANTNCWTTCGQSVNEASGQKSAAKKYSMFKEWFSDSDFCRRIHALYWKHRARMGRIVEEGGDIDQNEAYLAEALLADDAKWSRSRTAANDTAILKDNLAKHLAWMDEQFKTPKTLHDSVENFAKEIQSAPQDYVPAGTFFLLQ